MVVKRHAEDGLTIGKIKGNNLSEIERFFFEKSIDTSIY